MDDRTKEPRDDGAPRAARRPYEPPRVVSEDVFETTALACAKRPSQGGTCAHRAKTS